MAQDLCSPCHRVRAGIRLPWAEAGGASVGHAASCCLRRCQPRPHLHVSAGSGAVLLVAHSRQTCCAGVMPAFTVAAMELASGACMAVSGISIVTGGTSGRERAQPLAAGRWSAAAKQWRAWLALLSALAWCPALFLARQVGCQRACIQQSSLMHVPCGGLQPRAMLSAGWEHATGVAVCVAASGATGLCVADRAGGCMAVSEREGCSTAAQTHVRFQGAVSDVDEVHVHVRYCEVEQPETKISRTCCRHVPHMLRPKMCAALQ